MLTIKERNVYLDFKYESETLGAALTLMDRRGEGTAISAFTESPTMDELVAHPRLHKLTAVKCLSPPPGHGIPS